MSDQFLGEIRIFSLSFAPAQWAFCNGQLLAVSQFQALFSLLGTNYGGNGTSNFALPNLQGRVPVDVGNGPGLSPYNIGQTGGTPTVTLLDSENPSHNHLINASSSNAATTADPSGNLYAKGHYIADPTHKGAVDLYTTTTPAVTLKPTALGVVGGGQPHNNMMPYLTLNFCIALQGIFPPRG
jgi:microcystin-dependent protein